LNFMEWLGSNQIPFAIIFTKVDKLKPKNVDEYLTSYKDILLETWEELPQYFVTSSSKSIGKLIVPNEDEIKLNNRSRSAKLRIAEKL
ncbi:16S rRNA (cytosine(1402)-N(4))-methyltransferase, partial [Flavobacteriaceae bacterium]|nr:16S rRNA (cytosine(1402)-N(4))-methyltransferase [Flavobacteriaceae bacterium]